MKAMTTQQPNKPAFPFPLALMAIDMVALVTIGLCIPEIFPEYGTPLGLIPSSLALPIFVVCIVVAAICGFFQFRSVRTRNKSASTETTSNNVK